MFKVVRYLFVLACVCIAVDYLFSQGNKSSDGGKNRDVNADGNAEGVSVWRNLDGINFQAWGRKLKDLPDEIVETTEETRTKRSEATTQSTVENGRRYITIDIRKTFMGRVSAPFMSWPWYPVDSRLVGFPFGGRGQMKHIFGEHMKKKRSLAIGRSFWRPGKRFSRFSRIGSGNAITKLVRFSNFDNN
ncbi:hypothetical protein CRE_21553 [Caenorhabditis remanei]|uniref:Uncharacterized protein n=1 Tax=Caenorhabditis remanei TaxID=31234 RepID=E3NFN3_CAERE|nr:hypothetical protein CRE_21553 [Caenorhabditis remanei]